MEGEGDITRLESGMSFMQVRASMSMKEKLRQVRGAICMNRREIAHTRLEAIAGADNPYSLITIFGRGHLAIKAGGAVYVTRCSPLEVILRSHKNCTEEIPVTVNGTDAFVDPISYVIKSAGSPIHCNDVAPLRYKVGGKWYCSYPVLKECHDPEMLPVDEVRMDPVKVNDIDLGKSIYTKEQLEEFARFQDSQGTRKAYLAETAEMVYTGCNEMGVWGLALSSAAQGSVTDRHRRGQLLPALQGCGANDFLSVTPATGVGRAMFDDHCPAKGNNNSKMQGVWYLGANGLLGDPLPAGNLAFQLGGCGNGRRGSEGRPDDGDRGRPRARRRRGEEEKYEPGEPKEEVFVVAEWSRKRGVIRPSPQYGGRSRGECCPEDGEDHQTLNVK